MTSPVDRLDRRHYAYGEGAKRARRARVWVCLSLLAAWSAFVMYLILKALL
jgi:hypothetical protein